MSVARDPERGARAAHRPSDGVLAATAASAAVHVLLHSEPLRVVLLNERGQPVTGARVTVEARQVVVPDSLLLGDVPGLLAPLVGVTFGDGEVCFERLADVSYRVSIAREGYVARSGIEGRPGEDLIVTLREGRTLSGQVIDADTGAPIAGAMVRVKGGDWDRREETQAATRTDHEGRFEACGVGDHAVELSVAAPWYPLFRLEMTADVPAPTLVMRRAPRGVTGRVIDGESRQPVDNVRVVGGGSETVTDTEGHFILTGIARPDRVPGRTMPVELQLEHDDHASVRVEVEVPVDVPGGEAHAVDVGSLELAPRPGLAGSLLDDEGAPVTGALVVLAPAGSNVTVPGVLRMCMTARTGPDGRFSFGSRPETRGPLHLSALVPGFAAAVRAVGPSDSRVALRLQHGLDLSLAIPGAQCANRTVILEERGGDGVSIKSTIRRRPTATDAEGRVTFAGVRPGNARVSVPGGGVMELEIGQSATRDITFATATS